ncbi:isocitrate lyase/PEP mutase family protein [Ralstonia insidiosa]|jgi:2-methylisocitrate lyase-like PEP mutase family enzyme|uniref:isocitrate lyase/PEP mutase family protein n=1 Tax=Ralstonia TaxID=48736 RepID=UPI00066498F5|nr:isocitrate lyase/PEP mutase family protein [Ralstonia insidiosa]KMW49081.1 carboxyvinyl-carboxyphosphonate phosphorylmutase [Ralstonia sp. MD27]MBX3773942.1 isocitrate lyase/PEP mutase family protein [Ralstonia pickettii]NOZ17176.1 isocitrate lyase/PEP mutase family protein [Betaproteobacteria bacterium]MBA9857642.1 carboxyvinyl-carboxyphosphonate phosphorylmutase [Ralstonia insidiosa]MBA9871169.1 carboxyvinyl-carboxyphosphonate phosphorylmutase [Ralstonia insidiosa]
MNAANQLRQLLARPEIVVAPGAYDGLTARLIQQAGFAAVYMTGAGTAAARGFPDFGLLGMSEMVDNAAVIARSADIPLIADADTGYGNELNVTRTVREFEARNVAAIHLEDQVFSKRCGHLDGKEIVERDEYIAKIRAAVAARRNPDFTIIARTDARAVVSLDEAIERANLAIEAGADMAFVEAPRTLEEVAAIPREVKGPCLLNLVPAGRTPLLPFAQAQDLGYRMVILPGLLLKATMEAGDAVLRDVRQTGQMPPLKIDASVAEFFRRFGSDEWSALRQRFQQNHQG